MRHLNMDDPLLYYKRINRLFREVFIHTTDCFSLCYSRKNSIVLRTQLSVRVHTIIGEYRRRFDSNLTAYTPTIHLDGSSDSRSRADSDSSTSNQHRWVKSCST